MAEIDYQMLAKLVTEKIRREGGTLDVIGRVAGISSSTMSRVSHGIGKVDANGLFGLCQWLNISPDRLTGKSLKPTLTSIPSESETSLEVIHALILRDKNLEPDAQTALFRIMEVGYMLATK